MQSPRYPHICVSLKREGQEHFIRLLSRVLVALEGAGVPQAEQSIFLREATAGDDAHLLHIVSQWVATVG
jgi:hypothetical protein